jgi:hypothetical protein
MQRGQVGHVKINIAVGQVHLVDLQGLVIAAMPI